MQESFKKVAPIAEQAAEMFYNRLFELDPAVKPLFKSDMIEPGKKLMAMIATAVKGLNKLDKLVPEVKAAWTAVYGLLADVMLKAAERA